MIVFSKRQPTVFASASPRPTLDGGGPVREPRTLQLSALTTAYIHAGDFIVVADPCIQITTVLGSCVSACILDPLTGIGGMNHFILPDQNNMSDAGPRERYGKYAMRALLDALYARGAVKGRLRAKLYGGAKMLSGGGNIGLMNAKFAQSFLHDEEISIRGAASATDGISEI
jgi:chemotaxis protein CheD